MAQKGEPEAGPAPDMDGTNVTGLQGQDIRLLNPPQ
jgi:hypothetical protein